jgi:Txe/YoeB family toxin of Txe-Axe toxin-antitoxin module
MDQDLEQALEPGTEQVNPAPEPTATAEAPQGQPGQVATVEQPNFYKPEEIEQLLSADQEVDTARLSPEGRLLMKSFQKGFTPKLQERSELKRELENLRKEIGSLRQPASIEEVFDKDPEGTLKYIESQIAEVRKGIDTDPFESIKKIEELRAVKDNLVLRSITGQRKVAELNRLEAEVKNEVLSAIPDFDKKESKLTQYALEELGYTLDEIRFLTSPANTGRYATKFIVQVNKMYEMNKAKSTVEEKRVKTPPKQESAGTGEGDSQAASYRQALKEAQKSQDWTEVLKMKGVLQKLVPGGS